MTEELKPCPFCKNTDCVIGGVDDPRFFLVVCRSCHTQGPARITEAEAIAAWNTRAEPEAAPVGPVVFTDEFVEHLTHRFLGYPLPKDFRPDNGVTAIRPNYHPSHEWRVRGTNLLDYDQSKDMVRYMLEGAPSTPPPAAPTDALVEKVARLVRLFPEAHDTLTRQEMRDAKGNWRSLIDQQTAALAALSAALAAMQEAKQ